LSLEKRLENSLIDHRELTEKLTKNEEIIRQFEGINEENSSLKERINEINDRYELLKKIDVENPELKLLIEKINLIEKKEEELITENFKLKEEKEDLNKHLEKVEKSSGIQASQKIIEISPLKTKAGLEEDYKNINAELKDKIRALEFEKEKNIKELIEITQKYESLRDLDSPMKEVSEIKKLLKQRDSENQELKENNKDLSLKLNNLEDLLQKQEDISQENFQLKQHLSEITEKYETLRDIDSPIKEVSQIRKLAKQNDSIIEDLKQENII